LFNSSSEIDFELLSKQLNETNSPVNLVIHTPASAKSISNAGGTPDFILFPLPFRPDQGFHEYRFDWIPDKVSFYADGQWLVDMTYSIPSVAGSIFLNHWSNGRSQWSGGPPSVDAVMTVEYVKAFFNSTNSKRQQSYTKQCVDPSAAKSICQIPDKSNSNGSYGGSYFFTSNSSMVPGQVVGGSTAGKNGAEQNSALPCATILWIALFSSIVHIFL
jgi:beta-glucanase (GH16 family)